MKPVKSALKFCAGTMLAGLFVTGGAVSAQALNFQWQITNNFGTAITLDRASCSNGGSVSAPFSIANGATVTFTGTSSATSDLCNVRYQSGTSYGCQFQVQTNGTTGFTSTNAYKGTGGRPSCTSLNGSGVSIPGGWSGSFKMQ